MTDMDNRRQAIIGYALIGGFVALFIVLNWVGPGGSCRSCPRWPSW